VSRNPRVLLAAALLLGLLVAGVVLLTSGGDTRPAHNAPLPVVRSSLTLQQRDTPDSGPELLISLPEARLNSRKTTGGDTSVALTCFSAGGARAFRVPQPWPMMEEFGYPLPHLHVPVGPQLLETIRRCRLTGPGIDLEGQVPGRLPRAR
jgi:hypothetical protein